MTDARIEAAARALCDAQGWCPDGDEITPPNFPTMDKNWKVYEEEAQIAVSAADAAAWRPIESAPRDGAHILTYYADGRVMADTFPYRGFLEWQEQLDEPPIYWHPLPAPPYTPLEGGGNG